LTLDQFKQLFSVEFVSQLDKLFACGNFGDPAVGGDTMEIFEWVRSVNPTITLGMNTNGGVRDSRWWTRMGTLMNLPHDYVVFSIDGLEDTNHIYRRRVTWSHVMRSAESFVAGGGHAHWDMLVFDHNQHQIESCKALARSMGFVRFRSKVSNRFQDRPVEFLAPPKGHSHTDVVSGPIQCHALNERSLYVSATGQILPCCFIGSELFTLSQELETYIQEPGYSSLVSSWNTNPPAVCQRHCSTCNNVSRFHSQWQEDSSLC
jgi:sulfatase maturation enzyme AslB (radical SAM superfamily)